MNEQKKDKREKSSKDWTICPFCNAQVEFKNMHAHFEKWKIQRNRKIAYSLSLVILLIIAVLSIMSTDIFSNKNLEEKEQRNKKEERICSSIRFNRGIK